MLLDIKKIGRKEGKNRWSKNLIESRIYNLPIQIITLLIFILIKISFE